MIRKITVALLAAPLCFFVACGGDDDDKKSKKKIEKQGALPTDLSWVRKRAPGGVLAYSADKQVYIVGLDGKTTKVGEGFLPEWSPDGSKLAWVRGGPLWVSYRNGKEQRMLHDKVYKIAGVHWLDNDSLAAVIENGKRRNWYRFWLDGRRQPMPELDQLGIGDGKLGRETDIRQAKDGVWSYVAYQSWKTSDGKKGPIGGGCACSISPDGLSITALQGGHQSLKLKAIRKGGVDENELHWAYDGSFDNHRWSSNDERFLVGVEEDKKRMFIVDWRTGQASAFGKKGHKDNSKMYGDFTQADGSKGRPFPPLLPSDKREVASGAVVEPTTREPVVLKSWPYKTEGMAFLFEDSGNSNEFREFKADPPRAVPGMLCGAATINRHYGLDLTGGTFEIDSSGSSNLLERVKASGTFAVEFVSKGAAAAGAVVSFGENFSIGAPSGEGYRHVVASYADGKFSTYVNGAKAKVPTAAKPIASWVNAPLVLGEGWDGQLDRVAIFARAVPPEEAARRYELVAPKLLLRKPAPQVVAEAELVTYTPPLPLDAMDTYRRCLSEHIFKVTSVASGELDTGIIRVLAWSTLDMKILPEELKGKEGSAFRLTLEPKDAHPQLTKERVNATEELDPPEFLLVAREAK